MGRRPSAKKLRNVILECGGVINEIATTIGVDRGTVYNWIKKDDQVAKWVQEARDIILDVAETALQNGVAKGSPWAVKYTLSTLGKHRGYSTKTEITGDLNHNGSVTVYLPDNGREAKDS